MEVRTRRVIAVMIAIVATTATTAPEVEEDAVAVAVVDPAAAVASRAGSE